MKISIRFAPVLLLVFVGAGCGGGTQQTLDPGATYDALGAEITPDEAVAAAAVFAEPDSYIGKTVKIEGAVTEVCQNAGCWLTMGISDSTTLRVDVPRDSAGAYVYTFPKDISGRRIIVAGLLASGEGTTHDHEEGETHEPGSAAADAHSQAEARAMKLDLALVAQGALVERIRTEN